MVSTIGTDPMSGVSRFTFGSPDLLEGIAPIFVMVGLFAVTELMTRSGVKPIERQRGQIHPRAPAEAADDAQDRARAGDRLRRRARSKG